MRRQQQTTTQATKVQMASETEESATLKTRKFASLTVCEIEES
jgi:hypothetical protein